MTVLVIMTAATFAIWVPYHFDFFRQQNERLEAELLGKQKQLLKDQVDRAIDYMGYMRLQAEWQLKKQIKARVYEVYETVSPMTSAIFSRR